MMRSLLAVAFLASAMAFAPPTQRTGMTTAASTSSSTLLYFGIPTFGAKDPNSSSNDNSKKAGGDDADEKKISAAGLIQLITAGLGSPFLGEFEGIDPETGNFMFSLEANNLVDEVRNRTVGL